MDIMHGELMHVAAVAEPVLGFHQRLEIVGDGCRAAESVLQHPAELDVTPAEERRPSNVREVAHNAAETHANGRDRRAADREPVDQLRQQLDYSRRFVGLQVQRLGGEDPGAQVGEHAVGCLAGELDPDKVL